MAGRMKIFGCIEKAPRPVEVEELDGTEYRYWNCPLQFVPLNVWEFFKMYRYMKDFPGSMPAYPDVCPRFMQAYLYYESQRILLAKKV